MDKIVVLVYYPNPDQIMPGAKRFYYKKIT
jgi:hypothetical protein